MSFYRDKIRTARKEHKCTVCRNKILPSEKYHDKAGKSEYGLWYSKECMACQPVIVEFCKSDYYERSEGYCDEWIQEWWREVKCYDCKHRWLPCKPDDNCKKDLHWEDDHCPERTRYGTCMVGDECDDMTHYCRCEKFESESESEDK